ncbi:ABC transporter ATP-binding protein [Cellulomonas sp. APG4]|nr:ABC transporter ATP-binding protein [Cellulomonas sp. APG4]
MRARGLSRTFEGRPPVQALAHASLDVAAGERLVVLGPSGSGKSTLLNLLGLLDAPSSGSYAILGAESTRMRQPDIDRLRRDALGFVFQAYHVLGNRTAAENVALKLRIARVPRDERDAKVARALGLVGLSHLTHALGSTLSGGEKQRLAIARAVVNEPQIVLADEPTGNLDDANADTVLGLLASLAHTGVTVIVITHDSRTAAWADRVLRLEAGVLDEPT